MGYDGGFLPFGGLVRSPRLQDEGGCPQGDDLPVGDDAFLLLLQYLVHHEGADQAVVVFHLVGDVARLVHAHVDDAVHSIHAGVVGVDGRGDYRAGAAAAEHVLPELERDDLLVAENVLHDDDAAVGVVLLLLLFGFESYAEFLPAVVALDDDGGPRLYAAVLEPDELLTFWASDLSHGSFSLEYPTSVGVT